MKSIDEMYSYEFIELVKEVVKKYIYINDPITDKTLIEFTLIDGKEVTVIIE